MSTVAVESYRQSTLAGFEICPRRTYAALQTPEDLSVGFVEAMGDLGTVFHAVAAEMLRTFQKYGHSQMATQEAVEVMREVYAASPITLPSDERDVLRELVLGFCNYRFPPERILAIERPLSAEIRCLDGVVRRLTGIPDLLMFDGDAGIIINDWKTGKGRPQTPRGWKASEDGENQPIVGKQYLSQRGHFQGDTYSLLGLLEWSNAEYAIFRELHLRSGEIREATIGRAELEHIEPEIAMHMQKLSRAIGEGEDSELWKPRPGRQCAKQCPVVMSCPIPAEQRGLGQIDSPEAADALAARFVVLDAVRNQARALAKAYHEETGLILEVGDGTGIFWEKNDKGKRDFGVHPLEHPNERNP